LYNLEFANEYVTPRGMIVRDKGVTFQPLFLTFANLYKGEGFLNDVTLVLGVWNDFGSCRRFQTTSVRKQPENEVAQKSIPLPDFFWIRQTLQTGCHLHRFREQILSIGTSQHLEVKFSADDTPVPGASALHPYISFWQELDSKATAANVPQAVFGASRNVRIASVSWFQLLPGYWYCPWLHVRGRREYQSGISLSRSPSRQTVLRRILQVGINRGSL